MFRKLTVYFQYLLPKHLLTWLVGWMAKSRHQGLKNFLINRFIRLYKVDLTLAQESSLDGYPSFNDFFIRTLQPHLRPITTEENAIASPVDGTISQLGQIQNNQLLQAKNTYFSLETLLGNQKELTSLFLNGNFATLYLAPYNYHRIHMPLDGQLIKSIYVPGKLFSVNRLSSAIIPNLYSRNERLITLFETQAGPMAIILVGALICGCIKTTWLEEPIRSSTITTMTLPNDLLIKKGVELGYFKLGSTVILLFGANRMHWIDNLTSGSAICYGQSIGKLNQLVSEK